MANDSHEWPYRVHRIFINMIHQLVSGWPVDCVASSAFMREASPDNKVHGANMGSSWGRQPPGGRHVGHMNLAIGVLSGMLLAATRGCDSQCMKCYLLSVTVIDWLLLGTMTQRLN